LLPKIIGWFKMNSAKQINKIRNTPGQPVWQRNYYEHIIRDDRKLQAIREYIRYNPLKWNEDEENPEMKGIIQKKCLTDHLQLFKNSGTTATSSVTTG